DEVPSRGNARSGRDEFRETFGIISHGNPEPSRRYTGGRCRDYLMAPVPLMTGLEHPAPTRADSNARVNRSSTPAGNAGARQTLASTFESEQPLPNTEVSTP